jgi:hypothetical protein
MGMPHRSISIQPVAAVGRVPHVPQDFVARIADPRWLSIPPISRPLAELRGGAQWIWSSPGDLKPVIARDHGHDL